MMDECIDAQRVVSETYDGAEVPATEIQKAREHCEGCPECSVFVSTLASVRRLPAPVAPSASLDSAIAAVRQEKQEADAAREVADKVAEAAAASRFQADSSAVGPHSTGGTDESGSESGVSAVREPSSQEVKRWPKWAVYGSWATAAAATLIVAGVVTMQGARFIAGSDGAATDDAGYRLMTESAPTAATEEAEASLDAAAPAPDADVSYITIGAWVYELIGTEGAVPSETTTIATTTSSLDTRNAPRTLEVYSIGSASEVLVGDGERYLKFSLISRTFRGATYAMKSRSVTSFGQWPTLPSEIPEPATDDGEPVFSRSVSDDLGIPVYVLEGTSPEDGFAIPPNSGGNDPADGNPNWTWWERP